MTLTNAPAIVTTLSTQLAACASWAGGTTANHWYPEAPAGSTMPHATLTDQDDIGDTYASGAPSLPSGMLTVTIADSTANRTIGQMETFARTIQRELMAQVTGIAFRRGNVGTVSDIQGASEAGNTTPFRTITVVLDYGISA